MLWRKDNEHGEMDNVKTKSHHVKHTCIWFWYHLIRSGDLLHLQWALCFISPYTAAFSLVCSLVQGALFLVSAGLYLSGQHEYLGLLVMCLALSWVNLLYFSRGDRHMGIYSVMIQKVDSTYTAPLWMLHITIRLPEALVFFFLSS